MTMNAPARKRGAQRRAARHKLGSWLAGLSLVAASLVGAALGSGAVATPSAHAAEDPSGCGYATGSPGTYANTVCWIDFAGYDEAIATSPAGQPFVVSIGGGFTASFDLTTRPYADRPYWATEAHTTADLAGYSSLAGIFYPTAPGKPILWNIGGWPTDPSTSGVVWRLGNIVVTGPDGRAIQDFSFVSGDAESTGIGETVLFESDTNLDLLEALTTTGRQGSDSGCFIANTTGIGTKETRCEGTGLGGPGSANLLFASQSPTFIQQTIDSDSRNAGVFGIMMSKVQLTKVVDSRADDADAFDLGVTSGNSTLSTVSTGTTDTATTGPVTVLAGSTVTLAETGGSGTDLSRYDGVWSCSVNGVVEPALQPAAGTNSLTLTPENLATGNFVDCTITNTAGSYTVSKTASKATVLAGDTVDYAVTVKNTGPVAFTEAYPADFTDDMSEVLDDAVYNGDATLGAEIDGDTLSWSGPLAVGETKVITYSVTVNNPLSGDGVLKNAVVTDTGICDPDADCDTTTLVQSFLVAKTADKTEVIPGEDISYTITVTNTGQVAYTEDSPASFTDDLTKVLDDAAYNDDATGGASYDAPTLSWSGPLAVGESTTITYSATVNVPDLGDKLLTNAVVPTPDTGGECDPLVGCTTTTPVMTYSVHKVADTASVKPGDRVTYTVTVTNTGQAAYTAEKPASFTDDLSKVTDDARYNGDATNGAIVTGNTLTWSGPLAVGESSTITYSVTVNDPITGDKKLTNVVVADGPGGECVTVGGCTTNTTVTSSPPGLASTGSDLLAQLSGLIAFLLAAGAALVVVQRRRNARIGTVN